MIVDNIKVFYDLMNENILLKQMPFVLGMAFEYRYLPIYYDEENPLTKAYLHNKDLMCKHKPEMINPSNKKAICLFYSFINREPIKTDNYESYLEQKVGNMHCKYILNKNKINIYQSKKNSVIGVKMNNDKFLFSQAK